MFKIDDSGLTGELFPRSSPPKAGPGLAEDVDNGENVLVVARIVEIDAISLSCSARVSLALTFSSVTVMPFLITKVTM